MSTARARGLGTEIRKLRKGVDLRLEELAKRCGWSRATLGRMESGDKVPTQTEVAIVVATLGITGDERARLLDLAEDADKTRWWEVGYSGMPSQLLALIDFERKAAKITDISLALMPGLLQTADYTRAIIGVGGHEGDDLESRVSLRLGRQSVLTRNEPVEYHAIVDESALYRPVGGKRVLVEQLRHLSRMAERSNVTLQIMPLSIGAHVGLNGNHVLLEFRRQRAIVHLEHRRSSVFLDEPEETSPFFDALPTLAEAALSSDESVNLIAARAQAMEEDSDYVRGLAEVQLQR
ncbi:transcriptional regulator with XRE-family HTH domain [Saccharopolyspora lacisalsi]|uniref:Transcriptional regulator with XRE-family HTH domain n=1 Tax=Halosaccharopolyspora lacisalsi TaxID=1000566 RepID=A0A839E5A5_9PSEU|nr:helix-turn-helix transcriptional regulator [Halosaccharopolyspora lacisalsi]MBA8827035.1 transcriptional regulator with XRE-family HTH domain [Halosaccharopolyspora lacisalsi]